MDFCILALILIAYKTYIFLRDVLRKRRNEQRQEKEQLRKSVMYINFEISSSNFTSHSNRYSLLNDEELMENDLDTSHFSSPFHLDIEFNKLCLRKNNKDILSNVSGCFRAGRLSAIMGASGCGKTTLLSVLSGKVDKTSGVIKISGKEDTIQNYRKLVGFVPQDDIMHRSLTVKENILFSARMRLSTAVPEDEKRRIANEVIKLLGTGSENLNFI